MSYLIDRIGEYCTRRHKYYTIHVTLSRNKNIYSIPIGPFDSSRQARGRPPRPIKSRPRPRTFHSVDPKGILLLLLMNRKFLNRMFGEPNDDEPIVHRVTTLDYSGSIRRCRFQ